MAKRPEKPKIEETPKTKVSFKEAARGLKAESDPALRGKLPEDILDLYEVHEWKMPPPF